MLLAVIAGMSSRTWAACGVLLSNRSTPCVLRASNLAMLTVEGSPAGRERVNPWTMSKGRSTTGEAKSSKKGSQR